MISTDEARERAFASGALSFVAKPIQNREVLDQLLDKLRHFFSRSSRKVLVVDPDKTRRNTTVELSDGRGYPRRGSGRWRNCCRSGRGRWHRLHRRQPHGDFAGLMNSSPDGSIPPSAWAGCR